jgi:hypothetical protein
MSNNEPLANLRSVCLALPETTEKPDGRPTFQVRDKTFAMFMDDHHGDGRERGCVRVLTQPRCE